MSINIESYGPLNFNHINRIQDTLNKSVNEYPRTMCLRIDLHLPADNINNHNADSTLITRFIISLKAQVEADLQRKVCAGKRVHPCRIRHMWAREFNPDGKKHYHLVLLFNKDTYAYPGSYYCKEDGYVHNLSLMIMEAWVRTLNLHTQVNYQQHYSLVHFPGECYYHLNTNSQSFNTDYCAAMDRIIYLAKEHSKIGTDRQRNFGCSQY